MTPRNTEEISLLSLRIHPFCCIGTTCIVRVPRTLVVVVQIPRPGTGPTGTPTMLVLVLLVLLLMLLLLNLTRMLHRRHLWRRHMLIWALRSCRSYLR